MRRGGGAVPCTAKSRSVRRDVEVGEECVAGVPVGGREGGGVRQGGRVVFGLTWPVGHAPSAAGDPLPLSNPT